MEIKNHPTYALSYHKGSVWSIFSVIGMLAGIYLHIHKGYGIVLPAVCAFVFILLGVLKVNRTKKTLCANCKQTLSVNIAKPGKPFTAQCIECNIDWDLGVKRPASSRPSDIGDHDILDD